MAKPEEFEVLIDRDGRIRLDFRGMRESSYKRIVEVLRETVGPVEAINIEADDVDPPDVHERRPTESRQSVDEEHLEQGQKS